MPPFSSVNCNTARVNFTALSDILQPKTKACQCRMKWGCQALLCDRNQLFLPMKLQNIYLALSHMMPKPLKANRRLHQSRMSVNSWMEKHCATTRVRWEKFGKRQSVVVKVPSDRGNISQYEPTWSFWQMPDILVVLSSAKQNSKNRFEA